VRHRTPPRRRSGLAQQRGMPLSNPPRFVARSQWVSDRVTRSKRAQNGGSKQPRPCTAVACVPCSIAVSN
jgi:hypothetical protein